MQKCLISIYHRMTHADAMNTTLATITAVLLTTATAAAEPLRADVEVDPTAYALSGNSLHVGLGRGHWRVDLGNFALALPQWAHGDDDFEVSFDGYGAKLHYFVRDDQAGLYAGVAVSAVRVHVRLEGSELSQDDSQYGTGLEVGYRVALPHGFHVIPWLGVGTTWSADSVTLADETFDPSRLTVFPAVHVGYRFR
jgi:hypothetical protein